MDRRARASASPSASGSAATTAMRSPWLESAAGCQIRRRSRSPRRTGSTERRAPRPPYVRCGRSQTRGADGYAERCGTVRDGVRLDVQRVDGRLDRDTAGAVVRAEDRLIERRGNGVDRLAGRLHRVAGTVCQRRVDRADEIVDPRPTHRAGIAEEDITDAALILTEIDVGIVGEARMLVLL